MNKSTIKKINQINREFYHQTAEEFSRSRSYYWSGWKKILSLLNTITAQKKEINVLDVGCGNGRFGLFLNEKLPGLKINYLGIDFSQKMLNKAEKKLASVDIDYQLKTTDIFQGLNLNSKKFDLIACFGLFHHLPSFEFRQKILNDLGGHLAENGLIAATFWQFANKLRFKEKIVDPNIIGIQPDQLETNDYILDWKRGSQVFRYCHHFDQKEVQRLVKNIDLSMVDEFLADGKTNDLNRYLILKGFDK